MSDIKPDDVKIIQLVITPNNHLDQGCLIGLGDDGVTYIETVIDNCVVWCKLI